MKSSTLRIFTIVIAVLGLIGGVSIGSKLNETGLIGGTTSMITAWVGIALYAVPCYALASVLLNQEEIMSELFRQSQILKYLESEKKSEDLSGSGSQTKASNSALSLDGLAGTANNAGDTWTCKNCGEKNPRNAQSCKGCGQWK